MIIAITSITILTLLVWVINKKLPKPVCPICAGVTLTWAWLLAGMWLELLPAQYELTVAILMGATIGGIVGELKKKLSKLRNKGKSAEVEKIKKQLDDCCQ